LDVLPPRISDLDLLALLTEILAVRQNSDNAVKLRLRLVDAKFSWQALADLAIDQGVLLPLIWALRHRCLLLPVPARQALGDNHGDHPTTAFEAVYRQYIARRNEQAQQLVEILGALNRASVVPLLLKGARYLIASAWPWCEARDMRDLDLLVRKDDASRAVKALADAGYVSSLEFVPIDQHLPEMWLAGRPSAVEIHTEALSFSGRKLLTTEEVWKRSIPCSTAEGAFYVLPDEWQLLHGLLNHQISDHCHARRLLAVKALWEFAMLGEPLKDRAWHSIADHLAARGHADILGSVLVQAERLFGFPRPGGLEISSTARAHAEATFRHAGRPNWLRRGRFLADQVRHGFARETMAVRYGIAETEVTTHTVARHLRFLLRHYRGQMWRRLTGGGDRPA
jgi:hypothetical protein